jgi:hypothetical protein
MDNTTPAKALLLSCTGETLTEILAGTAQETASLQAISSTDFPISLIMPVFSAGIDYDIRSMEKPSDHAPVWAKFDL